MMRSNGMLWAALTIIAAVGFAGCGGANPAAKAPEQTATAENDETPNETPSKSNASNAGKKPAPKETPKKKPKRGQRSAEELAASSPITAAPQPVPLEMLSDGWIALFDEQTLFGWSKNSDANWRVEDGAIVVDEGEMGLLTTAVPFANYQLRLEFKADEKTNSGIFLRTPANPMAPDKDCYELNIAPADNPFPTGSLVRRSKVDTVQWKDEWRAYDVTVDGNQVIVLLDGEKVLEYEDPQPLSKGFIGLQLNEGRVAFRRILLRPLQMKPIFNGENLDGWTAPESPAVFTVTEDGDMNVKNGRGHLESVGQYGDFVLQLECISHAEGLNSGLFFRCIPGSAMDGYESQIHNGFLSGDRRAVVDHGTGGIFNRELARLVVADDLDWFYKTIVADGPDIAVWVNGYQVTSWKDEREPDENPRRGLRTEQGSLMIQGHDPTTNLSFRNLKVAEQ